MNSEIEKALNEVSKLDSWDIQSILGGVNYITRQAEINTVVRMIPELPEEGSGLEGFTNWEIHMRDPDIQKAVSPIVGIAERVTDVLNEYTDLPPSDYEDVLKFMLQRPPRRETFEQDYNNRKRLGMRPTMPMSQFCDMEMATAVTRHNHLVAKGEAAVHVLHSVEGTTESAPEWLDEAIMTKIQQKLEQRWLRAELRRTNPKITKNDRDLAEANQLMIEKCMRELGGEPPKYVEEMKASDDIDEFIAATRRSIPPLVQ